MKILQLAPLWECVPPVGYGGTEYVVSLLTDELVRLGHDVTLVASGDSRTAARLAATSPRSLRTAFDIQDSAPHDWLHAATALAMAKDFDVVHNHAGELSMAFAPMLPTPMLTTMHCLPTVDNRVIWDRYDGAYNTISRAEIRSIDPIRGPARFVGHVYNAVDVNSFPYEPRKGDDLLFLSRLAPEKGAHHAIEIARRLGMRLILAGKVDRVDRRFFEEAIEPHVDGEQIVFVGEANAAHKRELYRKAKCLLLPLTWEEPFGLVMVEAMACGTPVVALRRGSAGELILHGRTGFVVDTVDEMVDAVRDVNVIDPAACREHVTAAFSPETMARDYLRVYERLLEREAPDLAPVVPSLDGDADSKLAVA